VALGLAFGQRGPQKAAVLVTAGPGSAPEVVEATRVAIAASPLLTARVVKAPEAESRWRRGDALVLVRAGDPPRLLHDPSRPGAAAAALAVRDALERAAGRRDLLATQEEAVWAPGKRYIDFLIPGLLGMSLMSGGIWGIGWALVNLRIKRLLKRFAATPMHRPTFLGSFLLHRLLVSVVETAFLLGFGRLAFGVRVHGSLVSVGVVSLFGAASFAGLGLLVACRARNAETANGLMNLATLPMWVLSGVFFASSNFPDWMRPLVDALPLTALNDALRAVVNDGAGLGTCLPYLGVMATWGLACFALALRWFRWQ
jgi:ABC-type multidrug transport system permease subunit